MNEEELLRFISRIISSGNESCINLSMNELLRILQKEEVDEKLIKLVVDLADTSLEAANLGTLKHGEPVTMEELSDSIREGRARLEKMMNRC